MVASEGLDPVLVVVRPLTQGLRGDHGNTHDLSKEAHHVLGTRQTGDVAMDDNAVEAMVKECQQVTEQVDE